MSCFARLPSCLAALVLVIVAVPAGLERQSGTEADLEARARAILRTVPLVDGHNDLPWAVRELAHYDFGTVDIRLPQPKLHTDIPRLRGGQVGAQFWSVYVPSALAGRGAVTATLEQIAAVHELARRYPDVFEIAGTAADIRRIFASGKIASMMGVEGGHSIDSSLPALRMLYRLGARYMTLTHGASTPWADSATDLPKLNGLSRFGEAVVREMNWLGMLVDLSHVSPDTMVRAIRVSEAPVIFSHSSARALCDVPRNVPDEVLRLVPANGGLVMITFVPDFISPEVAAWSRHAREVRQALRKEHASDEAARQAAIDRWTASNPPPRARLAQVADHVDHVRRLAGVDHVGLGSDFDGMNLVPEGLEDVSRFPALVAELLRRGYREDDVRKIVGLNALRVMERAEQVAARLQVERPPSMATIEELDGREHDPTEIRP
jgi:membrane dipeptidase